MQSAILFLAVLSTLTQPLKAAPTPESDSQTLSEIAASLSSTNQYGAPIPPWISGNKPGWYFGPNYDNIHLDNVPYLDSVLCEWLNQLPDVLHCPNTYPHPHHQSSYTPGPVTTHNTPTIHHRQYSYYTPTYETNPVTAIETTSTKYFNTKATKYQVAATTKYSSTKFITKHQYSTTTATRHPSTIHTTKSRTLTSTTKRPSSYPSSHGYGYGSPSSSYSSPSPTGDIQPPHTNSYGPPSSTTQGYGSPVTTSVVYGLPPTKPGGYGPPASQTFSTSSAYGPPPTLSLPQGCSSTTATYSYTPPIYDPPTPSNGYTQTIHNITAAVQANDYMTFGLVNTIEDCLKMCDVSEECGFVNTYHDVHGKDGSLLLTCSLFRTCHGPEDADNAGGQTQSDGTINYILNSNGWCKLS